MSLEIKFASRFLLSSEDKVDPKKHKKIFKKLAPNKYTDVDTGYEISFATAYDRQNPQALKDYKRALGEKPKEQKQKSTQQLQEQATEREKKRKDRSQSLDEHKSFQDSFASDLYDNPSDFIETLRKPKSFQKGETRIDKIVSLANEYGEWAEENNEESIKSLLGLETQHDKKSKASYLKKNEEEAKENRKKLKNGEISALRFNDLEQRRKGRLGYFETRKRHEVRQKIFSWKRSLEFPDLSSSETVKKLKEESERKSEKLKEESEQKSKKMEEKLNSGEITKEEFNDFEKKRKQEFKQEFKEFEKKRKKELADASINAVLESDNKQDVDLVQSNPALKLMKALRKSHSKERLEQSKKTLSQRQSKELRSNFLNTLVNSVKDPDSFGSKEFTTEGSTKQFLSEMTSLVENDQLAKQTPEEISEGFSVASRKLSDILSGKDNPEASLLDRLKDLQEEISSMMDSPVEEKNGKELGAYLLAGAMEKAFLSDPLYGVDSSPSSVFTRVTDSAGKQLVVEDEEHLNKTSRFSTRKLNMFDLDSVKDKFNDLSSTLKKMEKKGEQGSATFKSLEGVRDGAVVSMILKGEKNLPQGFSNPPQYLVELARQTDLDPALDAIKALSKEGGVLKEQEKIEIQRNFLNNLSEEHFEQALGGKDGPFSEAFEAMDEEICPDIPMNGDMAGQPIGPGDSCPFPVAPEVKKTLRKHMTQMMVDHYTLNPTPSEKGISSGKKKNVEIDKSYTPSFKMEKMFKTDKKEFQKALTKGSEKEREEALSLLIYKMRVNNLKNMDFGEYGEGEKVHSKDDRERAMARRNAILKMLDQNKTEDVSKMLQNLDTALEADFSMKKAHSIQKVASNFYSSFISRRYLDRSRESLSMKKTSTPTQKLYKDYKDLTATFKHGLRAYPYYVGSPDKAGVIVGVFPAIGMVDLKFPHGVSRFPVEDLVLDTSGFYQNIEDSGYHNKSYYPVSAGSVSSKKVASLYLRKLNNRR